MSSHSPKIKATLQLKLSLTGLTADRHVVAALQYYYLSPHHHLYLLQTQHVTEQLVLEMTFCCLITAKCHFKNQLLFLHCLQFTIKIYHKHVIIKLAINSTQTGLIQNAEV